MSAPPHNQIFLSLMKSAREAITDIKIAGPIAAAMEGEIEEAVAGILPIILLLEDAATLLRTALVLDRRARDDRNENR